MSLLGMAVQERVEQLRRALEHAQHGAQTALVAQAAADMDCSIPTVYARLRKLGYASGRKLRSDRNDSDASQAELMTIAAIMQARPREHGKIMCTTRDAIAIARANNMISTTLSDATLTRMLRRAGLDHGAMQAPRAHVQTQSLHPNHVWQIDSSICVLYYLRGREGALQVMREDEFNVRKPQRLAQVLNERVLRYCATDHTSGSVCAQYYLSAGESQRVLFDFLMHAMLPQSGRVMHGVPLIWELDKSSANTSHAITQLAKRLGARVIPHAPKNARANGQVEGAHNIIERGFEARLAFKRVENVSALNADLDVYLRDLNDRRVHSRHGATRSAIWQLIKPEQLRLCPDRELCQQLMMAKPQTRTVRGDLTVSMGAALYSVEAVPQVRVGEQVEVSINPYTPGHVYVRVERDGAEVFVPCAPLARNQWGFLVDAPVRGETFKQLPDGVADTQRKQAMTQAWDTTDERKRDARMRTQPAFDGRIDPMADLRDATAQAPSYMARKGTSIDVPGVASAPHVALTFAELCRALRAELGRDIAPEENAYLRAQGSNFARADVTRLAAELQQPQPARPRLVAVR